MSQPPEDLPQPIYEDPSLTPPPPPPPGGQYTSPNYGAPVVPGGPGGPGGATTPPGGRYPVPGYVPPPPPGGVHGYAPPPAPGGAASSNPKSKLPLIIAGVVGVIAVIAVLIVVMASGTDTPTPPPNSNPPKNSGTGPGPTDAPTDPKVASAIKVLFPSANSGEASCMASGFADKTDIADKIADQGGTSGEADEAGVIADIVTGCVTTDRLAAAVMPNIQQEYQQGTGLTLTADEISCAESSLASLSTSDFNAALRAYYQSPPTPFTTSFNDALSGCAG